jgi:hypothetical protein
MRLMLRVLVACVLAMGMAGPALAQKTPPRPPAGNDTLDGDARKLFEAIQKGDPELAVPFFLPRETYAEVKAVKDPTPHYERLLKVFKRDVVQCKKEHPGIERGEFVSFEPSPRTKWMAAGREVNRVGYFVRYRSRLNYTVDGKPRALEVRVMLDAGGRWTISHLRPFH